MVQYLVETLKCDVGKKFFFKLITFTQIRCTKQMDSCLGEYFKLVMSQYKMFTITIDVKNGEDQTPLDKALHYNTLFQTGSEDFPDVALYLINCGCPEGSKDRLKILRGACRWGKLAMIKELIEQLKVVPKGNPYI